MYQQFLIYCQKQLQFVADWLQRRTSNAKKATLVLVLLLFCLITSSLCLIVVVHSIRVPGKTLIITPIQVPRRILFPAPALPDPPSQNAIQRRIAGIHRYLDSLRQSPTGKARYDSLVWLRPHLLDSLDQVQHYFFQP